MQKLAHPVGSVERGIMTLTIFDTEERCCVCGLPLGGSGAQKGLCDACMDKFREGNLAPVGQRCPLCGERRRRNLVRHEKSGEYVCHACLEALGSLPEWRQDVHRLHGSFGRRLGPA